MSAPDAARRTMGWRGVTTAATGILAGVAGVVAVRSFFGAHEVLAGALVGVVALSAGMAVSWGVAGRRRRRQGPGAILPGGRRLRHRVHPVAWLAPVAGSLVAVLAWAGWPTPAGPDGSRPSVPCWRPSCSPGWPRRGSRRAGPS